MSILTLCRQLASPKTLIPRAVLDLCQKAFVNNPDDLAMTELKTISISKREQHPSTAVVQNVRV